VHVALSSAGGSARLVVRDSGPGIPTDQIAHVFERFYQVDESTTRTQPGTGIGLSLVKELVELHGGTIAVESGPGGTTFTVTIPQAAATAAAASGVTAAAAEPVREAPVPEAPVSDLQLPTVDGRDLAR
jgi:signal transduction histidine kinase